MQTPPNKPSSSRRAWWIGGGVMLVALGAGAGAWWHAKNALPPVDGPPEPIVRLIADGRLKTVPVAQREAYVERLEKLPIDQRRNLGKSAGLTAEQAKATYRAIYDQAVRSRISKYYRLPTQAERDAYLDKLWAEFQREQAFAKAPAIDPNKIKQQLENVPAAERAQAASFVQDFARRGLLRGLGLAK